MSPEHRALVGTRGILTAMMTSLSPSRRREGFCGDRGDSSVRKLAQTVSSKIECEFDRGLIDDAIAGAINC